MNGIIGNDLKDHPHHHLQFMQMKPNIASQEWYCIAGIKAGGRENWKACTKADAGKSVIRRQMKNSKADECEEV